MKKYFRKSYISLLFGASMALSFISCPINVDYGCHVAYGAPVQTELEGANMENLPELQKQEKKIEKETQKVEKVTEEKGKDFQIINDSTDSISKDDIDKITSDLSVIFDNAKRTNANLRMYLFLYDASGKNLNVASDEIVKKSNLPTDITPLVLVINKSDNHYKLIIDERLTGYVSKAFAQNILDELVLNNQTKNYTYDNIGQAMIRISSVVALNIQNKTSGQAEILPKDFYIREDAFMSYDFSGEKVKEKEKDTGKETPQVQPLESTKKADTENDNIFSLILPILFVFLTIFIVTYNIRKKRKAGNFKG